MADSPEKRPTLRSLADITGLGISTVSQALRDSPEIALETRRRVQLAAQQAGYRPNRAGVRLRTGKSNVITLVLNAQDDGAGFFANIVFGISDALVGTPYHLVVTPYSLTDAMAPIRYIVETNSADGVIISRTQPNDPRVRFMTDNNMPFAAHGRTEMGLQHCYFDFDNEAFAIDALRQLAGRGRKRIALFTPPSSLTYYRHTLQGFETGLRQQGLVGSIVASVDSDSSVMELRAAARELAHHGERPDGIICSSTSQAYAVATGLKDGGLEMGRDYDLVAKPVTELSRILMPNMIAISEDFRQAGFELASMLLRRLNGAPLAELQQLVGPLDPPTN
jgi:LacI family transcriptional regulator